MKILVIEDDRAMAGFYKIWLGHFSNDVTVTGDIDLALTMIDDATQIITLDINLSETCRGDQTLSRIHELKNKAPNALLIVLTGSMELKDSDKAMAAGADGFIHKTEVFREKSFLQKFYDLAKSFLSGPPPKNEQHLLIMEKIAEKTANYFKNQAQQPQQ